MTWQDYTVVGTVLLNLVAAYRHHKLTLGLFQKALANNRTLLAKTLMDVSKAISHEADQPLRYAPMMPSRPVGEKPVEDAEVVG